MGLDPTNGAEHFPWEPRARRDRPYIEARAGGARGEGREPTEHHHRPNALGTQGFECCVRKRRELVKVLNSRLLARPSGTDQTGGETNCLLTGPSDTAETCGNGLLTLRPSVECQARITGRPELRDHSVLNGVSALGKSTASSNYASTDGSSGCHRCSHSRGTRRKPRSRASRRVRSGRVISRPRSGSTSSRPYGSAVDGSLRARAAIPGGGADRALHFLDRGAQGVDLVFEPSQILVTLLRGSG
jgi:hypothetical protein